MFNDPIAICDFNNATTDMAVEQKVSYKTYELYRYIKDGYCEEEIIELMKISKKKYDMLIRELRDVLKDIFNL